MKTLAEQVIEKASEKSVMIATVESCTGGLIIGALTNVAGSSAVVDRGFITYSNESKQDMVNVSIKSLEKFGAVSEAVAGEMAFGGLTHSKADLSISVTGIAGPGGGTDEKPVGMVCFGRAELGQPPHTETMIFEDNGRESIRKATIEHALKLLLEALS
ncbi:CinA family protein [Temperatibacter marinus]|uniref:CinA family protein n=1 Tax=Temperatibacter marinus TaxID=1456591 RepID=A0AA52EGY7_9PROT|nr:CinA family protein [Temperatibacter marinus]WND02329.1 CinA family protein [Temperatibacter marinus]